MEKALEKRLRALEKDAHTPFDFTGLARRLEALEAEVKELKRAMKTNARKRRLS